MKRLRNHAAFTLVEIVIAIAIVATGIIAIIGLIPLGLEASRQSAGHTVVAVILEDVHNRLQGRKLEVTPITEPFDFYYDDQGLFILDENDADNGGSDDVVDPNVERRLFRRNYLARAHIVDLDEMPDDTASLKAVRIELYSPINPASGEPMGKLDPVTLLPKPKTSVTYYISALTAPDWREIDPTYEPKIEF